MGTMQDTLARWGLADRTLVSLFADHGEEFLEHAAIARRWNHDPRDLAGIGHGHSHFQELLHVPWAAWGPGVPRGRRVEAPVSLLDLAPTLAAWLGVAPFVPGAGRTLPAGAPTASLVGRSRADLDGPPDDAPLLAEAIAYGPDLVMVRPGKLEADRPPRRRAPGAVRPGGGSRRDPRPQRRRPAGTGGAARGGRRLGRPPAAAPPATAATAAGAISTTRCGSG